MTTIFDTNNTAVKDPQTEEISHKTQDRGLVEITACIKFKYEKNQPYCSQTVQYTAFSITYREIEKFWEHALHMRLSYCWIKTD